MHVRVVDPRDVSGTYETPAYRVYFWKRPIVAALPEGVREDQVMYGSYEYELTGCHNVREALAWAEENAGADRSFTLYACISTEETTLVRLFGIDPTKNPGDRELSWPGEIYT